MRVAQWPVGNQGLLYDRSWMVVNQNGVCITQKQEPRLCFVQPQIDLEINVMTIKAEVNLVVDDDPQMLQSLSGNERPLVSVHQEAVGLQAGQNLECVALHLGSRGGSNE
uniref:Uncharacterized protein n=1 Tax=Sphaerodactylus townsendi TaxID=933632 RepID=A0ACB8FTR8_9SAUR